MQITDFHDAHSVTAQYLIGERRRTAACETILAGAARDRRCQRAYLTGMGHLFIRLGAWLQAMAKQPIAMEETV
jgi:hypothetical protein